jgi:hypothetical protein
MVDSFFAGLESLSLSNDSVRRLLEKIFFGNTAT